MHVELSIDFAIPAATRFIFHGQLRYSIAKVYTITVVNMNDDITGEKLCSPIFLISVICTWIVVHFITCDNPNHHDTGDQKALKCGI